jgi:hypothetical protein
MRSMGDIISPLNEQMERFMSLIHNLIIRQHQGYYSNIDINFHNSFSMCYDDDDRTREKYYNLIKRDLHCNYNNLGKYLESDHVHFNNLIIILKLKE